MFGDGVRAAFTAHESMSICHENGHLSMVDPCQPAPTSALCIASISSISVLTPWLCLRDSSHSSPKAYRQAWQGRGLCALLCMYTDMVLTGCMQGDTWTAAEAT